MNSGDPYVYPGSLVLRNRLGITDASRLEHVERELVTQRITEGVPAGNFDLSHLQAIHKHLFQDIYDWAGKLRIVEISKDGRQFQFRRFIETGMADIHRRLERANFLRGLNRPQFIEAIGRIMGDVNYVHPFREGNGRAQLLYLEQLAARAGHPLDLRRINPQRWLAASRAAHEGDYRPMIAEIDRATARRGEHNPDRA